MKSRTVKLMIAVLLATTTLFDGVAAAVSSPAAGPTKQSAASKVAAGAYVIEQVGGHTACRHATEAEATQMLRRSHIQPVRPILPIRTARAQSGLKIVLRGTDQLEEFPAAKQAFIDAAAVWEAIIATPITVVVDVDFGPTRFGIPFASPTILGATNTQDIDLQGVYPQVRAALIETASSDEESALYNALPADAIPTDIGATTNILTPSANLRALGLLPPVADPDHEPSSFGDAPSIGFNSDFTFDLDPSDGVEVGKYDFQATAIHELGHVLGFISCTGLRELDQAAPVQLCVLDLLRFRPEAAPSAFATAPRILSSGGDQVFFDGREELPLSTGRPDSTGGDEEQSSHWKEQAYIGYDTGIMNPVLYDGSRDIITASDLLALDRMGYRINPEVGALPMNIVSLESSVERDDVVNTGAAQLHTSQYKVQVPADATELKIELHADRAARLYASFCKAVTATGDEVEADYAAASASADQMLIINATSAPPLHAGTYYIAVVVEAGTHINLKATRDGGAGEFVITSAKAKLDGDLLSIQGTATHSGDGSFNGMRLVVLDGDRQPLSNEVNIELVSGEGHIVFYEVALSGLNQFPTATQVSVVLTDDQGEQAAMAFADFSQAEPGAPQLNSASLAGRKMIIKGSRFEGTLQVEVNGVVVIEGTTASPRKVKLTGSPSALNLRGGANRVRIHNDKGWSNIFVLNL
jgi:hypothetical protein